MLAGYVVIEGDGCGDGIGLGAGGFFYGPRGRVHGLRCEGTETARLLVFVSPGTGVGAMFAELAELTRQHGDGSDPAHVGAVCSRYGIAFADFLSLHGRRRPGNRHGNVGWSFSKLLEAREILVPDTHVSAMVAHIATPATDLDMLKTLYREHADQARHHETARAQATNLILVLAAVLTELVTTKSGFGARGAALAGWVIVGVLLSFKHHERNRLRATIARTYRDYLAAKLSGPTIRELSSFGRRARGEADLGRDEPGPPILSLERSERLHRAARPGDRHGMRAILNHGSHANRSVVASHTNACDTLVPGSGVQRPGCGRCSAGAPKRLIAVRRWSYSRKPCIAP